jgi:hypothetical protein
VVLGVGVSPRIGSPRKASAADAAFFHSHTYRVGCPIQAAWVRPLEWGFSSRISAGARRWQMWGFFSAVPLTLSTLNIPVPQRGTAEDSPRLVLKSGGAAKPALSLPKGDFRRGRKPAHRIATKGLSRGCGVLSLPHHRSAHNKFPIPIRVIRANPRLALPFCPSSSVLSVPPW